MGMGMVAGLVGGLFGVGGGVIYVPMLGWWLTQSGLYGHENLGAEEKVQMVLGNSLALTLITGVLGIWMWRRRGYFEPRLWLGIGIPAGLVAVLVAWFLQQGEFYKDDIFRMVFTIVLSLMMIRNTRTMGRVGSDNFLMDTFDFARIKLVVLGLIGGTFSALTGLGGGAIMVPALQSMGMRNQARINALSMGALSVMALSSSLFYASKATGGLAPSFLLPTAVGTIFGIWPGIALARRLSEDPVKSRWLRIGFMIFMGVVLLWVNWNWIQWMGQSLVAGGF
jgi:uncharacterized membrane protein YfcA